MKLFKVAGYSLMMMDNYLCLRESKEAVTLSDSLGYEKTFFQGKDFEIITASSKKELLLKARQLKQKKLQVFFRASSEELLRFALEKAPVDGVIGVEEIHPTNSVHYLRGGLDQMLCTFARQEEKIVVLSFSSVLNSSSRSRLLARMMFNVRLCRKYDVKVILSNFSSDLVEIRSGSDLGAFERVLMKRKK